MFAPINLAGRLSKQFLCPLGVQNTQERPVQRVKIEQLLTALRNQRYTEKDMKSWTVSSIRCVKYQTMREMWPFSPPSSSSWFSCSAAMQEMLYLSSRLRTLVDQKGASFCSATCAGEKKIGSRKKRMEK